MARVSIKSYLNYGSKKRTVYIELTHMRRNRKIPLKVYVLPDLFDGKFVNDKHPRATKINEEIASSLRIAEDVIEEQKHKYVHIDRLKALIQSSLGHQGKTPTIQAYTQQVVDNLRENKQGGYAANLRDAINQFIVWIDREIQMHQIDGDIVLAYRTYLQEKKTSTNKSLSIATVNNYLRGLRKIWLLAQKEFSMKTEYPFDTGVVPTVPRGKRKKAQDEQVMRKVYHLVLNKVFAPIQQQAVESRILQICFQGMDFADLARIDRNRDIDEQGYFSFTRFKNRNRVNNPEVKVKVPDIAFEIIGQYKSKKLLPMFDGRDPDNKVFKTFRSNTNRTIVAGLKPHNITVDLGSKAMRHTWLTAAAEFEPDPIIRKLAVGHSIKDITEDYTKRNQNRIDDLNAKVVAHLLANK